MQIPAPTGSHRTAGLTGATVLLACIVLAVVLGLVQGQDASWDLRNYHYYDPYAFVRGRLDVDLAPAQLQSWFSPFWDLGYYALARSGVDSRVTTALLSVPAGLALFVFVLLLKRLAPGAGAAAIAAALVLGATGAAGMPVLGTTMSDWHTVALVLTAIWLVLVARDRLDRRLLLHALAGLCGGAAVGLKLTAAPFAIGLAIMVAALPGSPRARFSAVLGLAMGGVVGSVVVYGPWAWILYHRYGNPYFPLFNDVFGSPLLPPVSFRDERFLARGILAVLTLPLRICVRNAGLVSEVPLRDFRFAMAFPALAWLALQRGTGADRTAWRALALLFVVSYVLWASGFGILRYAVVLELLAVLALVAAAATLPTRTWRMAALGSLIVAVGSSTLRPDWTRIPHGIPAVTADVPAIASDAMVVLASLEPLAYVVPSFPPEVPVVRVISNFQDPVRSPSRLEAIALERVRSHRGPLLLLMKRSLLHENHFSGQPILEMLSAVQLKPDLERCAPLRTQIEGEDVYLCGLDRT